MYKHLDCVETFMLWLIGAVFVGAVAALLFILYSAYIQYGMTFIYVLSGILSFFTIPPFLICKLKGHQ